MGVMGTFYCADSVKVSIHAPMWERRVNKSLMRRSHLYFNSRSHTGATITISDELTNLIISIHALIRERQKNRLKPKYLRYFNSRSHTGATTFTLSLSAIIKILIHAPIRERQPAYKQAIFLVLNIKKCEPGF